MLKRPRTVLLPLLLALALTAAACADDAAPDTTAAPPAEEPPAEEPPEEEPPAETTPEPDEPAADGPILIGALTDLTANFTPWGVQVRDGMQLAINDINEAGGVDGRMLELVIGDTQADAEEGVRAFERLIEQGVVAAGGVISSDVGLATARVAEELQTPLFLVKAGAEDILTRDSRYTFRTCLPAAPMVAGPILDYAQREGLTRVGAIIADYAWGNALRSALEDTFEGVEGVELQIEVAPISETDFTTYLRSLQAFDPELIVATGHPPGSGPITVQSADLGFDTPITGAYAPFSLVLGGVAEAGFGRYADFSCADFSSDSYQDLARRYLEFSDNVFLEDDAVAGYGIVTMVAEAVGAVGDDPAAVAEYLHGASFDLPGYSFTMRWTEWGELAEATLSFDIIGEGPAPEGVNEAGDWYPEQLIISAPLEPYEP